MVAIKFDKHSRSARIVDEPFWPKRALTGSSLLVVDVAKMVIGAIAGKLWYRSDDQ